MRPKLPSLIPCFVCTAFFFICVPFLRAQQPVTSPASDTQSNAAISAEKPQQEPPGALQSFLAISGWKQACSIGAVIATGTITIDERTSSFMLEIDRSGRSRAETADPHVVMIATPQGGKIEDGSGTRQLTIGEATQHGSSALVPIFTPLACFGSSDVTAAIHGEQSLAISKTWHFGDHADDVRGKWTVQTVEFDPSTHLLKQITQYVAPATGPENFMASEFLYSDWRQEGPVMLPHTIQEKVGQTVLYSVSFQQFTLNAHIGDSEFQF